MGPIVRLVFNDNVNSFKGIIFQINNERIYI